MALKRNFQSLETFSMSSMTDVIFLLLIFFMVTSTIIFPAAIDVNLPQSSEQTSLKPVTEVYIDADKTIYLVEDRNDSTQKLSSPVEISLDELAVRLTAIQQKDSLRSVALYADSLVDYGKVVGILDMAARQNLKMVLATKAKHRHRRTDNIYRYPNVFQMTRQQKDKTIAAAITFVAMLIIIVALFLGGISFDSEQTAVKPVAELMPDEELFLEPEILKDLGEENAVRQDAPAEAFKGEPEHAETDNTKLVVKGDNPKPAPPVDKLVTTKKESPVQATEPSISKEEKQKVTSSVAKGFSSRNGSSEGKSGSSGAGGTGMGITGSASGRTFKGCPKPDVTLRNKTTVTVSVVIDSDGNVISAKASGGASASIRRACEQAAKGAKWSPKKGAGETRGSISFTITPR